MKTAAQIWLDYGRTLDVGATEKAFAELDAEMRRLRAALHWALGDGPDADGKWFGDVEAPMFRGNPAPFGWRRHLRKIAGMGDPAYDKERRTIVDHADEQKVDGNAT